MKDTIMEMPDYQRPYEKCLREGEQSLSDRELLAVILRCGVQGLSSLTLADKILNLSVQTGHSGLLGLFHASVPELMKIHGIGKVKAIQLKCIGELSKRMGIEMPITEQLAKVLFEGEPAANAIKNLMGRPNRNETESTFLS